MISLTFIEAALAALDSEVQALLHNQSLSLTEKDARMLPLLRESKVLKQTYEDLCYLRDNPPTAPSQCKVGSYKDKA